MIPDKRDTLGEIPDRFDALLANALAQEEEKPMKRKISTTILVAALLVVLLAATALAVGLRRSTEADAVFTARQALGEKYGLTTETLGLFRYKAEMQGNDWVITFIGESLGGDESKLGDYVVTISPGSAAQAEWSHDDVDPTLWQGAGLDAPVWGQEQMLKALMDKDAAWEAYTQLDWSDTSFEAMAERGGILSLSTADEKHERFRYLVPDSNDISVEEAREIARQTLFDTYAIDAQALEPYEETISFVEPEDGGERQYVVEYSMSHPQYNWYAVQIASPSAEMLQCTWNIDNDLRTLPDGPLDAYRTAVEEYMASGALAVQPPTVKADIVQRVTDAGWADIIQPKLAYVMPGDEDVAEDAALLAAKNALMEKYDLTEETFTLFESNMALLDVEGKREWTIDFTPAKFENWYLDMNEEKGKLGSYAVTLDAASGDILKADWDLADTWKDEGYTQSNWATAPAYHGKLLPWLLELTQGIAEVAARYPADTTIYDYSDEDIADYDALFRDAGFSRNQFSHGIPGPDDLSREDALAIAIEAVLAEMPVPADTLSSSVAIAEFSITDPETPEWYFSFQFTHEGVFVDFGVSVDARTGEILYTGSITGGNG